MNTPAFRSLIKTYTNRQFRRFVYADVIYFFAVTLFQTGLAFYGNDYERQLRLKELIAETNAAYHGEKARQVPCIPAKPVMADLMHAFSEQGIHTAELPIGYQVVSGEVCVLPLDRVSCFMISGRKKSGKTNLIRVIEEAGKLLGFTIVRVTAVKELKEALDGPEKTLIIIEAMDKLLDTYYLKEYDKDEEERLTEVIEKNRKNSLHNIFFVCPREALTMLVGRRIFEALRGEAYGIHLGGMVSEQNLFEFSELSFSQKSIPKKVGEGDIPYISDELFYGEVKIPLWEKTD